MDPWEYNYVKRRVLALLCVDLNSYKAPQMQRRLAAYLTRSGHSTWPHLFRAIEKDSAAMARLKDYLTINVTAFFRDPDKYRYLQETILPELLDQRSALRVWSAGCSYGQEAYSAAMLLAEATGPGAHHSILATDIDNSALTRARAGGPYSAEDLKHVSPAWVQRYFGQDSDGYWVSKALRQSVTFRQHDLLADPFSSGFDLIICRNVVIYFQASAKEELYRRFYRALRTGGVLFVGGTEVIARTSDIGFDLAGISFYRRGRPGPDPAKQANLTRD